MTHVMEVKTSCNEQPQPESWGPSLGRKGLRRFEANPERSKEPDCKHTLLHLASVAQVTKVNCREMCLREPNHSGYSWSCWRITYMLVPAWVKLG